jgi:hypothetical protein
MLRVLPDLDSDLEPAWFHDQQLFLFRFFPNHYDQAKVGAADWLFSHGFSCIPTVDPAVL